MVNCSISTPFAEDFVRGLSPVMMAFLIFLLVMSLSTCALFMEMWVYLSRKISCTHVKDRCLMVLSLFPVVGIAAQLGLIVPRSAMLADLLSSAYTGMALFAFFHLTVAYLGGETEMLEKLQSVECTLHVGPCCCCCFCLPTTLMDRRAYSIFRKCVSQTVVLIPILTFIIAVLWADGKYFQDKVDIYSPVFYLRILMTISTLLSLYAFNVMVKTSLCVADPRYHLMAKYHVILVAVIINSLQPLIFELLTSYDVIPCTEMINWQGRASEFNNMVKVLEAFLLMLTARVYYRKPYPLADTELLAFDNSLLFVQ
ncbi:unnamed protein product [Arctogadus glacialis]